MKSAMTKPVQYDKRAISIAPVLSSKDTRASSTESELLRATSINVTVAGEKKPRNYKHVISTMPLACLRMVDTAQCGFSWNLQTAIRALHYDPCVKVGIRFSRRWWEDASLARGAHHGGASSTDRPARTVVYPSHGINEKTGATMIASYTWAEDAMRIGSLANSPSELLVVAGIIKDLADMHQMDHDVLANLVEDYKIHEWSADDTIMGQSQCYKIFIIKRLTCYSGGGASFGPSQFRSLYPEITRPVGGLLHFAGEATSVHHV